MIWPNKWAIASLLLDIDPMWAEENHIYSYLHKIVNSGHPYASVIETRLALARTAPLTDPAWQLGAGSLEEELEALRTVLGCALKQGDTEAVQRHIASPLFRRLPLADQKFWHGLEALHIGNIAAGRDHLKVSAEEFGYKRAALALSVHLLEHGLFPEAQAFFEMGAGERRDPKIAKLRAHILSWGKGKEQALEQIECSVDLLCYEAVLHYQKGNKLETVQKLRDAAHWVDGYETSRELRERANNIEMHAAIARLLAILFPEIDRTQEDMGRYQILETIIRQHPQLLDAQTKYVANEVGRILFSSASDARTLHALAVLWRESALKSVGAAAQDNADWIFSSALWVLLLCDDAFWNYFSYRMDKKTEKMQKTLEDSQQTKLFQDAFQTICLVHVKLANQAFAKEEYKLASVHLRCLQIFQQGEETLLSAYREKCQIVYPFQLENNKIEWVRKRTERELNEWAESLIEKAKKEAEEKSSQIKGEKLKMNYEAGIDILMSFIKLNIPIIRVLNVCLGWYNKWADELCWGNKYIKANITILNAQEVAEQLMPLCRKEDSYNKENRTISNYLGYRGLTLPESERSKARAFWEEALTWDPYNGWVQGLLDRHKANFSHFKKGVTKNDRFR